MKNFLLLIFFFILFSDSNAQSIAKWKIGDLENYMEKSKGPVIINFWATFCKPCIEEIPYFQQAVKEYEKKGVKLLLVSLDLPESYPEKIKKFAEKQKYKALIVWLDEYDADYFCPKVDTAWSGAIPASLFVNNKTGYRKFFEEQIPKEILRKEIEAMLGRE
jgi:thiol-disulfide isomerase/thioredoxin